jgi:hypothetical protein
MAVSDQTNSVKEMSRWIARWENEGGALGNEMDRQRQTLPPNYSEARDSFATSPLFFVLCALGATIFLWLSFKLCNLWSRLS